jgi:hypothetical protein
VHKDRGPVGEDVADVQAKIPKKVYCDAGLERTKPQVCEPLTVRQVEVKSRSSGKKDVPFRWSCLQCSG